MMRAVNSNGLGGTGQIRVVQKSEPPAPEPGQALVRVRAASLNYRDLLVGRGVGRWAPPPGRILGSDAAGEVVAVGEGVTWPAVGDRVIGAFLPTWLDGPMTADKMGGGLGGAVREGGFADLTVFDAASLVAAPAHMTDAEAATLVCAGVTAWQALSRAGSLQQNQSVLVQGTGGVSLMALQMARAGGARVIVTSSSDAKLDEASRLGASSGINYRTHEAWDDEVMRLTGGTGVGHVMDVGGATTLERSIAAVGYEGVVSLIGLLGGARAEIDVVAVHLRGIRLQGIETGSRCMLDELARWSEQMTLRPAIGATYAVEDALSAFDRLAAQNVVGKICLTFD